MLCVCRGCDGCCVCIVRRGAVGARVWEVLSVSSCCCLPRPRPSSGQSRFPLSR